MDQEPKPFKKGHSRTRKDKRLMLNINVNHLTHDGLYLQLNGIFAHPNQKSAHLLSKVNLKQISFIDIELQDVEMMNTHGIAILVDIYKKARVHNIDVVLSNANQRIKDLFSLLKVDSLFTLQDDLSLEHDDNQTIVFGDINPYSYTDTFSNHSSTHYGGSQRVDT